MISESRLLFEELIIQAISMATLPIWELTACKGINRNTSQKTMYTMVEFIYLLLFFFLLHVLYNELFTTILMKNPQAPLSPWDGS